MPETPSTFIAFVGSYSGRTPDAFYKVVGDSVKVRILIYLYRLRLEKYKFPYYSEILRDVKCSSSILPHKLRSLEEEDGLVASWFEGGRPRRKYYRLTRKGVFVAGGLTALRSVFSTSAVMSVYQKTGKAFPSFEKMDGVEMPVEVL